LDTDWRTATLTWATDQLAALGWRVVGEIDQPHVRPWSTVFRIPTDHGLAWCKASGRGPAYEGPLLDAFARHGIRGALLPLATDPAHALILFPDGGSTLRATRPEGTGDHDLDAWVRILRSYALLQQATAPIADELIDLGVPDLRPERMAGVLDRFVADDAIWARADAEDRAAAVQARERLPGLRPVVIALAEAVARAGIPATIQHDDLHSGNVLVGPDGDRIFDWGDASVAHPFGTLTTTLNSIEHHTGLDQAGPELGRVRDAYLEIWSGTARRDDVVAAARAATVLGAISRAASWERSFAGLADDELDGHGGATAAWLTELVERLDRWAATAG
jgi:Phosphotransferase enzyme family